MISKYRQKDVENIFNVIISLTKKVILTWEYEFKCDYDEQYRGYWTTKMDKLNRLVLCREKRTFELQKYDFHYGWLNKASGEISKTQLDELLTLLTADNDVRELNRLSEFVNNIQTDRKEQNNG